MLIPQVNILLESKDDLDLLLKEMKDEENQIKKVSCGGIPINRKSCGLYLKLSKDSRKNTLIKVLQQSGISPSLSR